MLELATTPVPQINPHAPPALLDEFLLPLSPHGISSYHDECAVPHWTIELELWYQAFEPSVWDVLETDQENDWGWLREAAEKCVLQTVLRF
ncbi:hypothetical protein JCM6882_006081 [Rhodosporidiobolus microsporus]